MATSGKQGPISKAAQSWPRQGGGEEEGGQAVRLTRTESGLQKRCVLLTNQDRAWHGGVRPKFHQQLELLDRNCSVIALLMERNERGRMRSGV